MTCYLDRKGEWGEYTIDLNPEANEEEIFGMFSSILSMIKDNQTLSRLYICSQLQMLEENADKEVLDKLYGVNRDEVS